MIIFDTNTWELLHVIESDYYSNEHDLCSDSYFSSSFSPDGNLIAIGGEDGIIQILDLQTENEINKIIVPNEGDPNNELNQWLDETFTSVRYVNYVNTVQFSSGGKYLLSGTSDGIIRVWDVATNKLEKTLRGHSDQVVSVAYSPDETQIASISLDNTMCIWDVSTGNLIKKVMVSGVIGESCGDVTYHPNGEYIVTASSDFKIKIWDKNGKEIGALLGHYGGVNSVVFSPNGESLVSASDDNTVKVWDLWDLYYNPWDNNIRRHSHWVSKVSFSPDGNMLLSSSHDKTVKLWDFNSGNLIFEFEDHEAWVRSACFSNDGNMVASASDDGTIRVWDVNSGECLMVLEFNIDPLEMSLDFNWSADDTDLDNVVDEIEEFIIEGPGKQVQDVFWSPDDSILIATLSDKVMLWNAHTGEIIGVHDDMVALTFSNDGTVLAISNKDNSVCLWDVSTFDLVGEFKGHQGLVRNVVFDPSDRMLATIGEDNIRVWDVDTGECIKILEGDYPVEFSCDGRIAFVKENSVLIMDCETWETNRIIYTGGEIQSISFRPNGESIAVSSQSGVIKVYNSLESLKGIISKTKERFKDRLLTPEERHRYYLE